MSDLVILVDENDNPLGFEEKLKAHQDGKMHRAFSIFIFNSTNQLLLQQRSTSKYHSGDLWTNTCCSHPRPDEQVVNAAHRRLKEEMGFDCELNEAFTFTYKVHFENGLIEHEYDHVLVGRYNQDPILNLEEAQDFRWVDLKVLENLIFKNPKIYTEWLKIISSKISKYILGDVF